MADVIDLIDEGRLRLEDVRDGIERLQAVNSQAQSLGMLEIQKKAALAEQAVSDSIGVIEGLADSLAALIQGLAEVAENVG
ncbi:hypothetical protein SAMN05421686_10737 [Thalassolituus maritimus]|uniref:Uncharacterized protein n=1 Tax=Thalassolituus maritimus TaxID=484498 RepID=A0A1N7NIA3_9GAMM|nr:hypothetical protein [Thalassolituus maritimus]SIS98066.1 hypothetical protein SAMN05421686_10737 [Thalassolituus maritimus]